MGTTWKMAFWLLAVMFSNLHLKSGTSSIVAAFPTVLKACHVVMDEGNAMYFYRILELFRMEDHLFQ